MSFSCTWTQTGGISRKGTTPTRPMWWTVRAWAIMPDGEKETIFVRAKAKYRLADLVSLINAELLKFEHDRGVATIDAGFEASAHGGR